MTEEERLCIKCHKPVVARFHDYFTFEQMHWLCFHFEFEHADADPDVPCGDVTCPWWHIELYKKAIVDLGGNPELVLENAIQKMVDDLS